LSMILEASLESSFQMWFQTIYLFPILMYMDDFSFTSNIIWRIISIVASFLATAYSIVYSRNLDKKNTFKVTNIILLFARTFFEVVSRSLIVGCFIYINNDGNFGPHDAVGIYYVTTAFMCFINIFFNQVKIQKDGWFVYVLDILLNSLGSVFSYNSYNLNKVFEKDSQKRHPHVSQFIKQAVYIFFSTMALIIFTAITLSKANGMESLVLYDVNGLERPLEHSRIHWTIRVGWVFYGLAVFCNVLYYFVHPTDLDFDMWEDKLRVYILGTERDWFCGKKRDSIETFENLNSDNLELQILRENPVNDHIA